MSQAETHKTTTDDGTDPADIEAFISRWEESGGSESANFQMFANELCELLALEKPDPSRAKNKYNEPLAKFRI